MYSESSFFIQNTHRLPDVPMMRLTFAFRFGQMDMSLFKRKNIKAESEGSQNAMQGIGNNWGIYKTSKLIAQMMKSKHI